MTAVDSGLLLMLAVIVPFVGAIGCFAGGGRSVRWIAAATILVGVVNSGAVAVAFAGADDGLRYLVGGWSPPLGIALRGDGLAVSMMLAVSAVVAAIGCYAWGSFATPAGLTESRTSLVFWTLALAIWGSLNLAFLSSDLFTLYVALELLTFAAVPLVSIDGRPETLRAALRYLLFALFGSVFYLLGAVLLYGAYGTLDIALLSERVRVEPAVLAAAAMMTTGLLAKTALFPLHLWLPPAHAGAPAAASAILSGLVIKGSWFIVVRLWFDALPTIVSFSAAQLLAGMGAMAILVGNVVALRQQRLKLLVAYSTVAQIGYLFLMFPLAFDTMGAFVANGAALHGGLLQAISHALAKAAMFMAAGSVYYALGHDRIAHLAGAARVLPLSFLTFALAGIVLMGLPPSGGYIAKKIFLDAAAASGQWWWGLVLEAGAYLTAGYLVLVFAFALGKSEHPLELKPVPRLAESAALALALVSLLLGFAADGGGVHPYLAEAVSVRELLAALLTLAGGATLALCLAARLPQTLDRAGPLTALRRATSRAGVAVSQLDAALQHWAAASLGLLAIVLAFAVTLY